MEKQLENTLLQIMANQVVLYKKLGKIEDKLENRTRMAGISTYLNDLKTESQQVLEANEDMFRHLFA